MTCLWHAWRLREGPPYTVHIYVCRRCGGEKVVYPT